MELSQKTTILLSPRMHRLLKDIARARRRSVGELIREACEAQYGVSPESVARDAVDKLASLELPVGTAEELKRESVPAPEDLLP